MLRKMILAGMMTATALGGVAPAHAQPDQPRAERPGPDRSGGDRGPRFDRAPRGDAVGQGWRQRDPGANWPGANWQSANWQGRGPDHAERPAGQPGPDSWQRGGPRPADNGLRDRPAAPPRDWTQAQRQPQPDWRNARRDERRDWRDNRDGDWRNERRDEDRWRNDRRGWNGGTSNNGAWNNGGWNGRDRDWGRRLDDRARWSGQRRWDNGWRQDRRYDWQGYRARYGDRYRIGRYDAPRGWGYGYQRFSIGIHLDSLLYGNSYWLDDPYSYRLPPAYGTLRWVRYYDDALLVDVRDGYVVDAIHNFFW